MNVKTMIILVSLLLVVAGCPKKDPTGHLTQATGELQYGRHPEALAAAARHSEKACIELTEQLYNQIGKQRVCDALRTATERMFAESQRYREAGNLVEAEKAKDAHRRLYNIRFNYCQ